jgi:hypothetical protein
LQLAASRRHYSDFLAVLSGSHFCSAIFVSTF